MTTLYDICTNAILKHAGKPKTRILTGIFLVATCTACATASGGSLPALALVLTGVAAMARGVSTSGITDWAKEATAAAKKDPNLSFENFHAIGHVGETIRKIVLDQSKNANSPHHTKLLETIASQAELTWASAHVADAAPPISEQDLAAMYSDANSNFGNSPSMSPEYWTSLLRYVAKEAGLTKSIEEADEAGPTFALLLSSTGQYISTNLHKELTHVIASAGPEAYRTMVLRLFREMFVILEEHGLKLDDIKTCQLQMSQLILTLSESERLANTEIIEFIQRVVIGQQLILANQDATARMMARAVDKTETTIIAHLDKHFEESLNVENICAILRAHVQKRAKLEYIAARERRASVQEILEIERRHKLELTKLDDVARAIVSGYDDDHDPVYLEATRFIISDGVSAALQYLDSHLSTLFAQADSLSHYEADIRRQKQRALEPVLLQADLLQASLSWSDALALITAVTKTIPEWSLARRKLGSLLLKLGKLREAEPELESALQFAADESERSSARNDLGALYFEQGRYSEAESLFRLAISAKVKFHGVESPANSAELNNLATLYQATNRLDEAEAMYRNLVRILESQESKHYYSYLVSLNNLASFLISTNRLQVSEPILRRALTICEKFDDPQHSVTLPCLYNLARVLKETSRLKEAEALMRVALKDHELLYGTQHHLGSRYLNNLGKILQLQNNRMLAEQLMRRSLELYELSYGCNHRDVAVLLGNLGQILRETSRFLEAEVILRRAIRIDISSHSSDSNSIAANLNNMAWLLYDTKRFRAAESLIRWALNFDEQTFGAEHFKVCEHLYLLSLVLKERGLIEKAAVLNRRAIEILVLFHRKTSHVHSHLEIVSNSYEELLLSGGMSRKAIKQRLERILKVDPPLVAIAPKIERFLGPAQPIDKVLLELDSQYRAEGRPHIFWLPVDEPISPHLDKCLGKAFEAVPLTDPISPHLNDALGPMQDVKEMLAELDHQYRRQHKPEFWTQPIESPIFPHFDALLGKIEEPTI